MKTSDYLNYMARNTWPNAATAPAERGEGIYFWDVFGKRYTDFSSQTLNLLLGQCHPKVVEAITEQAKRLTFASSRFATPAYLRATELLVQVAPSHLKKVNIKMCDGSDANETAVKIAKKHTGRTGIVSFYRMHTGQTTQTIQLRGYGRDPRTLLGNWEDVVFIDPPACTSPGDVEESLRQLQEAILVHGNIAAVLIDPVMVNAGVLVSESHEHYLRRIEQICREHGVLFILDENQSFGWVPGLFATNYFRLKPDLVTLGKGLSAGHPLAGVLMTEELAGVLDYNEADFTHGGHVLTCAAATACLTVLQTEDLRVQEKSEVLLQELVKMKQESRIPFSWRGIGLIYGIEIAAQTEAESERLAEWIDEQALAAGVFLRRYGNKLILKPPVIVTEEQIRETLATLRAIFRRGGM